MTMPPHMPKPGRPTKYTLRAALAIARLLSEGWTLRQVAQLPTDHSTLSRWALEHVEFRALCEAAFEHHLGTLLAIEISKHEERGEPVPENISAWAEVLNRNEEQLEDIFWSGNRPEDKQDACLALARLVHAGYGEPAPPEDRAWIQKVMRTSPRHRTPEAIFAAAMQGVPPPPPESDRG